MSFACNRACVARDFWDVQKDGSTLFNLLDQMLYVQANMSGSNLCKQLCFQNKFLNITIPPNFFFGGEGRRGGAEV